MLFLGILRTTPSVSLSTLSSTNFTVVRTTNLSITARSLYFSWSINLASFLFCLTCSLTAKTGISQYAWPRVIRSWVGNDRRIPLWHCIRELKLSKHVPEQYFEGRIMTREVLILWKLSAEQLASTWGILSAVLAQNLHRASLEWYGMGLTCVIDLCQC